MLLAEGRVLEEVLTVTEDVVGRLAHGTVGWDTRERQNCIRVRVGAEGT